MDFAKLRNQMLQDQIIRRNINDENVITAMRKVPRHEFVPPGARAVAYDDGPIAIGEGQTISQPYMVALMTQTLNLTKNDMVLEIGTGSGYQTAVLAQLCKEVYTIERNDVLSQRAQDILKRLNYTNIHFYIGDGTLGWPEPNVRFDAALITAASPCLPEPVLKQLSSGGRLVIPIGDKVNQTLVLLSKVTAGFQEKEICSCVFVPLIGEYGWN